MSEWVHRTIVVPSEIVEAARNLGACLHPAGAGMFTTPLSPSGSMPATHWVSSGLIEDVWLVPLSAAEILFGAAQQGAAAQGLELTATFADATALLTQGDISNETAEAVLGRLGLRICNPEEALQ